MFKSLMDKYRTRSLPKRVHYCWNPRPPEENVSYGFVQRYDEIKDEFGEPIKIKVTKFK